MNKADGSVTLSSRPPVPARRVSAGSMGTTNNNNNNSNSTTTTTSSPPPQPLRQPRVPAALQTIFLRSLGGEDVEKITPPPSKLAFRIFPRLGGGFKGGGGGGGGGWRRNNSNNNNNIKLTSPPSSSPGFTKNFLGIPKKKKGEPGHTKTFLGILKKKKDVPVLTTVIAPPRPPSLPLIVVPPSETVAVPSSVHKTDVAIVATATTTTILSASSTPSPKTPNRSCPARCGDDEYAAVAAADASTLTPPPSWLLPSHQMNHQYRRRRRHHDDNDDDNRGDMMYQDHHSQDDHSHHIIPKPPPTTLPPQSHLRIPVLRETAGVASRRAMLAKQQQLQQQEQEVLLLKQTKQEMLFQEVVAPSNDKDLEDSAANGGSMKQNMPPNKEKQQQHHRKTSNTTMPHNNNVSKSNTTRLGGNNNTPIYMIKDGALLRKETNNNSRNSANRKPPCDGGGDDDSNNNDDDDEATDSSSCSSNSTSSSYSSSSCSSSSIEDEDGSNTDASSTQGPNIVNTIPKSSIRQTMARRVEQASPTVVAVDRQAPTSMHMLPTASVSTPNVDNGNKKDTTNSNNINDDGSNKKKNNGTVVLERLMEQTAVWESDSRNHKKKTMDEKVNPSSTSKPLKSTPLTSLSKSETRTPSKSVTTLTATTPSSEDAASHTSETSASTLTHPMSPSASNKVTLSVTSATTTTTPSTPHEFLMKELSQRGYSTTLYSSLDTGYHCRPTVLQQASYGIAFTKAVANNDVDALQDLLSAGLSPNPGNAFGESLVHVVCRRGNARMLQILMDHGGSIQVTDDYGRTPLHDACWRLADPSMTVGSDKNGKEVNDDDGTMLPPATTIVQLLLESDPYLVVMTDARGAPPLDYVQPRDFEIWIQYLKHHCLDKFWPHRVGRHYRPPPALALLPPHSVPIPDPDNAPPLEVATMVANGQITPQDAILLMLEDEDDDDGDGDDGDSDIDSMSSESSSSSYSSDDYYDCDSKCGIHVDIHDKDGLPHDSDSDSQHTEYDEEKVDEAEMKEICLRVGGCQAMARRCGWKETDVSAIASTSSSFMAGGKWE